MEGCISRSRVRKEIRVMSGDHRREFNEKLHASRKNAKEVFATIESYEIVQTSLAAAKNSERYVNPPLLKR